MVDRLRDQFVTFLGAHQIGVLSLSDRGDAWAMPVRYTSRALTVACLLPRWAEISFRLESSPGVLLTVPSAAAEHHWLGYQGSALVRTLAEWPALHPDAPTALSPDDLYQVLELAPRRLELIDERHGWGR